MTHVIFILDHSGSMAGRRTRTGGFNSYVDEVRDNPEGRVGSATCDSTISRSWCETTLPWLTCRR